MSLRAAKILMMYPNSAGDSETVDSLLIYRQSQINGGADLPEHHLRPDDYLYFILCRDEKPLRYWDNMRQKEFPMRYDEETFTPILRDARMKYMGKNFAVVPSSSL